MSDTPETDALVEEIRSKPSKGGCIPKDFARKLERERDEAKRLYSNAQALARILVGQREVVIAERDQLKRELQAAHIQRDLDKKSDEENNQLRKVADELAEQYRHEMMSMFGHASDCDCSRCEPMTKLYNSLPHVIERNKAK